jgi:hypothetical protein
MQTRNHAESNSTALTSSDTAGRSSTRQEGGAIAHQIGESEALARGTDRSITRGNTVTNSLQTTDGFSDSVGHTSSHGIAVSEGETLTNGKSVTLSPFYEYRREVTETPVFMTAEEQKLLVMQRLSKIPKFQFLIKAPESPDVIVRAPFVRDPIISQRRLSAGLQSVYTAVPYYTTFEQHSRKELVTSDALDAGDVIDVQAQEVSTPEATALPSPAPDTADEANLWERWTKMGRGILKKS